VLYGAGGFTGRQTVAYFAQHRAAAAATRIVPFCGFDSIPSDVGALLVTQRMKSLGTSCAELRAYFQMRGGVNGGTVASALHMIDSGRRQEGMFVRVHYDPTAGAWIGPFVMAPINTWVVHRSADFRGKTFSYVEVAKYNRPLGAVKAYATAAP
jgi:short subunit dehydrogenase-like uncharacterized protein